jgi:hypothetical protein
MEGGDLISLIIVLEICLFGKSFHPFFGVKLGERKEKLGEFGNL